MLKLAITLTHNKSDQANIDQIEALKPLIKRITDTHTEYDSDGNAVGTFDTYHYELKGLGLPHELRCYQIVPYGVTPPPNFYDIDSHNVLYRAGDEDKTGDHPRFFNWGLKRATDYGAEAVIHLENVGKFNIHDLPFKLTQAIDPSDKTEFIEDAASKITTLKLLKEVGQLDERKSKDEAISDFKEAVLEKGMEVDG